MEKKEFAAVGGGYRGDVGDDDDDCQHHKRYMILGWCTVYAAFFRTHARAMPNEQKSHVNRFTAHAALLVVVAAVVERETVAIDANTTSTRVQQKRRRRTEKTPARRTEANRSNGGTNK